MRRLMRQKEKLMKMNQQRYVSPALCILAPEPADLLTLSRRESGNGETQSWDGFPGKEKEEKFAFRQGTSMV